MQLLPQQGRALEVPVQACCIDLDSNRFLFLQARCSAPMMSRIGKEKKYCVGDQG